MVTAVSGFLTHMISMPKTVGASIFTLSSPLLTKYLCENRNWDSQKWRWPVSIFSVGAATMWIAEEQKMSLGSGFLIASAIACVGHTTTMYSKRRVSVVRDPIEVAHNVLSTILPNDYEDGNFIFYYLISTNKGFSLIFYDVPFKKLNIGFTHGCDPMGAVAHPMLADVRLRKIPQDIYQLILQRMRKKRGCPPILAIQGRWVEPDRSFSEVEVGSKMKCLLSSWLRYSSEQYPDFDLQVLEGRWKPMPQNPDLQGVSFEFFDQSLEIWMHEANESALHSAITAATKQLNRMETKIAQQQQLIEKCKNFLAGTLRKNTFFSGLPKASKSPHSGEVITEARNKLRQNKPAESEVRKIIENAETYLDSLKRERGRIFKEVTELTSYRGKNEELRAAVDPATKRRLEEELSRFKVPTSHLFPTVQIKQSWAMDGQILKQLTRRNLLGFLKLFTFIQHQRMLSDLNQPEVDPLIVDGDDLLQRKAAWIARNPSSSIALNEQRLSRECKFSLGGPRLSNWDKIEWILNKFAEYEIGFGWARQFPFLDEDIAWFEQARSILLNALKKSGKMTFELEELIADLNGQFQILHPELAQERYLVKRLSKDGEFLSKASKRKSLDPLAKLDDVHIRL